MDYPNTRAWAKKQGGQSKSLHDQTASGGSANLTPSWSPGDQARDSQESKGNIVSRTTLNPRSGPPTMSSGPPTPRPTNGNLVRNLSMPKAPLETRTFSPAPSPARSIPSSPSITRMMMNRQMQHDSKDPYNFYEDNDSEKEIDYPATPPSSGSSRSSRRSSSSVCSSQSGRSERGGTPTYDESGWRLGNFFTTQRR